MGWAAHGSDQMNERIHQQTWDGESRVKSRRCHPLNITPCPACREPILGAFGPDEIAVVIESRVSPVTKKVCSGACGWGAGPDPLVSLEVPVVQLYPLEQGVLEMCCCQCTHARTRLVSLPFSLPVRNPLNFFAMFT